VADGIDVVGACDGLFVGDFEGLLVGLLVVGAFEG
jgi:hypothetical protein